MLSSSPNKFIDAVYAAALKCGLPLDLPEIINLADYRVATQICDAGEERVMEILLHLCPQNNATYMNAFVDYLGEIHVIKPVLHVMRPENGYALQPWTTAKLLVPDLAGQLKYLYVDDKNMTLMALSPEEYSRRASKPDPYHLAVFDDLHIGPDATLTDQAIVREAFKALTGLELDFAANRCADMAYATLTPDGWEGKICG